MPGFDLTAFSTFTNSTSNAVLMEKTKRRNAAMKRNYIYTSLLAGKADYLKGGAAITDQILLSITSQSHTHKWLAEESYQEAQDGVVWTGAWRAWRTPQAIAEITLLLNGGAPMSGEGRFLQIKDVYFEKLQTQYTDAYNFAESLAFAVPHSTNMESSTGTEPYSILALYNEGGSTAATVNRGTIISGLFGASPYGGTITGGAWTTVQGVSPTAGGQTEWGLHGFSYSNVTADDPNNLLMAFKRAAIKLKYKPPTGGKERYFDETSLPDIIVFCSALGIEKMYEMSLKQGFYTNVEDFEFTPRFGPFQFVYCSELDDAAWCPTGTSGNPSAETTTTNSNAGPRYLLVNRNDTKCVFLTGKYMETKTFPPDRKNPDGLATLISNVGNNYSVNRRTSGIIYPIANIA